MSPETLRNRLVRLLAMIREVKTCPGHTPGSLRQALAVSKAQFYRDKEILEKIGFSFRYDRGERQFLVESQCFLPVEELSLEEVVALVLGAHQLSRSGELFMADRARDGAGKLISCLDGNLLHSCAALLSGGGPAPDPAERAVVESLEKAISGRKRVVLTYQKVGRACESYEVDPYTLFFQDGLLYLDGYSLKAREVRTFRVSRIRAVDITDLGYGSTRGYNHMARYKDAFGIYTDAPAQDVALRFSRQVRPYIEEVRWHASQTLEAQPDGSLKFTVRVSEPREVLWWAMRWTDQVEVLSPDWLRQEARSTIERMHRLYGVIATSQTNEP